MKIGSIDGTHGWGTQLWEELNDGGIWGIPRCGLIYVKEAEEKRLVLIQRMPWFPELSVTEAELRERQDSDHEGVTKMMGAIGVEVVEDSDEQADMS